MKKIDWIKKGFEIASRGKPDFWPTGEKRMLKLAEERGESLKRQMFWDVLLEQYNSEAGGDCGGPPDEAHTVLEYFLERADFSEAWETEPVIPFPEVPEDVLLNTLKKNRFLKIGGKPEWIQYPNNPICPDCDRNMALLIQLKSLPDELRKQHPSLSEMSFADGGIVYLFHCKDCGQFDFRREYY